MRKSNYVKREYKALFVISSLLLFIYAFFINHIDCNTIVTWGYDLLESVRQGRLEDFPVYTYETHSMATNYTLSSNVVTAVWLLPVWLIECIIDSPIGILVYDLWYKVMVLISICISLIVFNKILRRLNYDEKRRQVGCLVFATSAIVLISVLGKGQIDSISVLFVLLAVINYIESNMIRSSLFIGIACLFKPFAILIGVPSLLLLVGKHKIKTVFYFLFLVGPYGLDYIITYFLMPSYQKMRDITNELFKETFGLSRIEEIFNLRINSILVFFSIAIVICFVAFYIGIRNKSNEVHILVLPTIMYFAYIIFVNASSIYWLINALPFVILIGLKLQRITDFLLLNVGINFGVSMYIPFAEKIFAPGKQYSIMHSIRKYNNPLEHLSTFNYTDYVTYIAVTIYIICMVLVLVLYVYENRKSSNYNWNNKDTRIVSKRVNELLLVSIIPQILYLIMVYVIC